MGVKKGLYFRNIVCISYCPLDHIQKVLQDHASSIKAYSYIFHDRFTQFELDNCEDGHKEPHFHILLRLNRSFSLSAVKSWFVYYDILGQQVNTLPSGCSDPFSYYDYLIHKNDPEKFQFSPEDRITSDESEFDRSSASSDDIALSALNDMLDGVPLKDIACRYGRDFIYHYHHIKLLYNDIKQNEFK